MHDHNDEDPAPVVATLATRGGRHKTIATGRKPPERRKDGTSTPRPRLGNNASVQPKPDRPVERQRRDLTKGLDPQRLKQHTAALESAGARRKKAEQDHKDAVDAMHKAASEALEAGIPMGIVHETLNVSRQWLYKMGHFKQRSRATAGTSVRREGQSAP